MSNLAQKNKFIDPRDHDEQRKLARDKADEVVDLDKDMSEQATRDWLRVFWAEFHRLMENEKR
jgi:hypothetical protein